MAQREGKIEKEFSPLIGPRLKNKNGAVNGAAVGKKGFNAVR